jgi:hypothetical protein
MQKFVPLSQRSSDEIRNQAELYQEMATTARTPEARRGLEALVVRFAALADQLAAAESRSPRPAHAIETDAMGMSSTAPR